MLKFLLLSFVLHLSVQAKVISVYLTWEGRSVKDNVTVNVLSTEESAIELNLYADKNKSQRLNNITTDMFSKSKAVDLGWRYSVQLQGLKGGEIYGLGVKPDSASKEVSYYYRHHRQSDELVILQGGDMSTSKAVSRVPQSSLRKDVDIIFIGGDIAYANGSTRGGKQRWLKWFEEMNEVMVEPDGRLIPLIIAIGNHEVNLKVDRNRSIESRAPYYFGFFPQGSQSYFVRELSDHTVVFALDSGHIVSHSGAQTQWLEQNLAKYKNVKNKLALYHVPLYPSHRKFSGPLSQRGRTYWKPVFDKYALTLAMENHDHRLKRTKKIVNTIYIGDGCWGTTPRSNNDTREYLEVSLPKQHVWTLLVSKNGISGEARGEGEKIFDRFVIK